ncbi:RhoGAP-domain-containing protein [Epithele typhae]|uniref:RhoGAP-domain-containing protein n=1 Tax=Epithele typhae TaxID=378194 RepID=UPI00200779DF|nr:RhoGAP-domain-containing protein [Epithele typhae]KAH9935931.1 RhoGAP-domain-containing protein [Epithele typhae]
MSEIELVPAIPVGYPVPLILLSYCPPIVSPSPFGPRKRLSHPSNRSDFPPTDRNGPPTRAVTLDSPHDRDQRPPRPGDDRPHARSEDLNHSSSWNGHDPQSMNRAMSQSPAPPFRGGSRPGTPGNSQPHPPSSSDHGEPSRPRSRSANSDSSVASDPPTPGGSQRGASTTTHTSSSVASTPCAACGKAMQGAFVRALGAVYHLQCFKCMDCGTVVASKFFPIDGQDGKQHPLCERDYFRRLNLICAKCGMALRGSYITACNKKFHVEHFTCSICPTLFGPQDSYYEHEGDVYCHFHYSTRYATKCAGCNSAILKQFVEINRNMRDECWHPECYMINKFWNVKVSSRRPNSLPPPGEDGEPVEQLEPTYVEEERQENAQSLREKQIRMEQQVYRIWTVLSAFEESSAACISDMLRQVSNGQYLEAIRMAEKFILHVEVLFATIDDLEFHFARMRLKGMSHVREARMLCRKTVDLFTLLSHTQETGARRMGMTQELLALVTGLAHYLKILIRIALTGALKLEREQEVHDAITNFLDKLHMLAIQGSNASARRIMKRANGDLITPNENGNVGTQGVMYGFKSLAPENAGESPFSASPKDPALSKVPVVNPPSDLCVKCNQTVEEDCVRLGTYQRWHSHCLACQTCGKPAAMPAIKEPKQEEPRDPQDKDSKPKLSTARRPPANVNAFVYEADTMKETSSFGTVPTVVFCTDHAHQGCRGGFQAVSRLEQYAFLLNVALRRLYVLLKKRGVVPLSPDLDRDPYRNSGDINRLRSVHLDRQLSSAARVPKRSTIVESPTGKIAHSSDAAPSHRTPHEVVPSTRQPVPQAAQQGMAKPAKGPGQIQTQQPVQQRSLPSPGAIDTNVQSQVIRPAFARGNTAVKIVEEYGPNSPAGMGPEDDMVGGIEDGITLADIPQLVEAAQAREQRRSLPSQNSIPYIAELNPVQLAVLKHCAVLVLQRSPLRDQFDLDEILELIEVKKSSFWKQLFKPGNDKKNVKKKGVFGVPLELLVEREGSDSLLGASRATLRIPSFVDDVISAMRQMDMSVEGIFRKNGNIGRLRKLTDAIDRDASSVDLTQDNPLQLAALLKKFFRELPDPLMTYKLHRLFIASQSLSNDTDRLRMLHMVSIILPKSHRDTIEVLFVFLKWVASFAHLDEETGSKMDLPNLATVICPSILYSRGQNAMRDESFGAIRVVTMFLEHQDELYCVPEEFLPAIQDEEYFSTCMELPSREFLKRVDNYMRVKTGGRTPGLTSPVVGNTPFNFNPGTPVGNEARIMPPRSTQSNPQFLDRPPLAALSPSDGLLRNGLPQAGRPQGSQLQHQPFSYPGTPQSSSQPALGAILSPQPRMPATCRTWPARTASGVWIVLRCYRILPPARGRTRRRVRVVRALGRSPTASSTFPPSATHPPPPLPPPQDPSPLGEQIHQQPSPPMPSRALHEGAQEIMAFFADKIAGMVAAYNARIHDLTLERDAALAQHAATQSRLEVARAQMENTLRDASELMSLRELQLQWSRDYNQLMLERAQLEQDKGALQEQLNQQKARLQEMQGQIDTLQATQQHPPPMYPFQGVDVSPP